MPPRNSNRERIDAEILADDGTSPRRVLAARLGVSERYVSKRATALGLSARLRRWTDAEDEALRTGNARGAELREVAGQIGRRPSECSDRWRRISDVGWRQAQGYKLTADGRDVIRYDTDRDGRRTVRVLAHRAAMEDVLGRPLRTGEVVHHIDCNKRNNRASNLHLFGDVASHLRSHRSLDALVPGLLAAGVISFNSEQGVYELCDQSQWRTH